MKTANKAATMGERVRNDDTDRFLIAVFLGYGLIAVGIYFTIRLRFQQILHFGEMIRSVTSAPSKDKSGITPLQALCTSLASRVGSGNIAGVAVALVLGGPGAIFWMWVVAFVGMAAAYAAATLAQLFKVKDTSDASAVYRGGPAFYISRGLGMPWLGTVVLVMVFWGAPQAVATVFDLADASMGLMATINLIAIMALSVTVVVLTRNYWEQRKAGEEPKFRASEHPAISKGVDHSIGD